MSEHDDGIVPERGWWKRAYPVETPIEREYRIIKKRFGSDIGNLVVLSYKEWGVEAARLLSRRILSFSSHEELFKYLVSKVDMFDEKSRKMLSSAIRAYMYNYYFEAVLEKSSEYESTCPGLRDAAIALFQTLSSLGYFYMPDCIVSYAMIFIVKCRDTQDTRCKSTHSSISRVLEHENQS